MAEAVASGEGPAGETIAEKGPERDFRRLQNYPLIRVRQTCASVD